MTTLVADMVFYSARLAQEQAQRAFVVCNRGSPEWAVADRAYDAAASAFAAAQELVALAYAGLSESERKRMSDASEEAWKRLLG